VASAPPRHRCVVLPFADDVHYIQNRRQKEPSYVKLSGNSILENLHQIGATLRGNGFVKKFAGDEPPLRSELFSSEQMKQHGKTLAGSHKLGPRGIRTGF